jgi:two-component system, response regulator PdtaR
VRSCLEDLLIDAGARVTPAASATEALGICGVECPSVLLADVRLGQGMNGFKLAVAARQRWPGIRCVLMSGDPAVMQDDAGRPDIFLAKPFQMSDLLRAVCIEAAT